MVEIWKCLKLLETFQICISQNTIGTFKSVGTTSDQANIKQVIDLINFMDDKLDQCAKSTATPTLNYQHNSHLSFHYNEEKNETNMLLHVVAQQ